MAPYQYQGLNAEQSEIRLVNLLPGKFKDSIEVEILHAKFSPGSDTASPPDKPHYEALSYVWGPEDNPERIKVRGLIARWRPFRKDRVSTPQDYSRNNGSELLYAPQTHSGVLYVRQNLSTALRYLRQPADNRILWIDAISINQKDVQERNKQVGRMGEIYSQAARVVFWLGPESEDSPLAMQTIDILAGDLTDEFVVDPTKPRYRTKDSQCEKLAANPILWGTQAEFIGAWLAIRRLFKRLWFSRLWVYQECQLATNGIFIVGNDRISLSWFIRFGLWFSQISANIARGTESQTLVGDIF